MKNILISRDEQLDPSLTDKENIVYISLYRDGI